MDEEKKFEFPEEISEKVENLAETVEDKVEETVENIVENVEEVVEDVVEAATEVVKTPSGKKTLLAVVITALVMVVIGALLYMFVVNPYNANCKYATPISTAAEEAGMTLKEFKEEYGLPSNMGGNTYVEVAQYYIPITVIAEQNGMTVDDYLAQMKEYYQMTDEEIASIDKEKAVIGDVQLLMVEASKRLAEATPDPTATQAPVTQEEAEEIARAILGDEVVDNAQADAE